MLKPGDLQRGEHSYHHDYSRFRSPTHLFDIALELFVTDGQGIEELPQADSGALLAGVRTALDQVTIVVKHQLGAHLGRLVAGHHTQVTSGWEGTCVRENV